VLVFGSSNSSNSNRLREIAEQIGKSAYLLDRAEDIDPAWLEGVETVGVTAGTSAPEVLVKAVIERLRELGGTLASELPGREEEITFPLPKALSRGKT